MQTFFKNNLVSLVIIIATILLAGVAVFTAWKLYSVKTSAPEKSEAAVTTSSCDLVSFTITKEEVYECDSPCSDDSQCATANPDYICNDITGTCRHVDYPSEETCTPPEIVCNSICSTESDCTDVNQNWTCYDLGDEKRCRLEDYPTDTSCQPPAPTECDDTCTKDSQCQEVDENYVCYDVTGTCRLKDYQEYEDCIAPSPSPTPTPSPSATPVATAQPTSTPTPTSTSLAQATPTPTGIGSTEPSPSATPTNTSAAASLPEAGVGLPTVFGIGVGTILLLGALILAL